MTIGLLITVVQENETLHQLWALTIIESFLQSVSLEEGKSFIFSEQQNSSIIYIQWKQFLLQKYGGKLIKNQLISLIENNSTLYSEQTCKYEVSVRRKIENIKAMVAQLADGNQNKRNTLICKRTISQVERKKEIQEFGLQQNKPDKNRMQLIFPIKIQSEEQSQGFLIYQKNKEILKVPLDGKLTQILTSIAFKGYMFVLQKNQGSWDLFSAVTKNGEIFDLKKFYQKCVISTMSASPCGSRIYCSGFGFSAHYNYTGCYEVKKNLWKRIRKFYPRESYNPNLSLCCWSLSLLFLFNIERSRSLRRRNYCYKLGLENKKLRWEPIYLPLPSVRMMSDSSACVLPYSSQLLVFQKQSLSFTAKVFKDGEIFPTQNLYFSDDYHGFLTVEEKHQLGQRRISHASYLKWLIKRNREISQIFVSYINVPDIEK